MHVLTRFELVFSSGGSKDWERSHQPQGCRAGWVRGPVQNQKTHTPQQTNEGVLWTTSELRAQMMAFKYLLLPQHIITWICLKPHSALSVSCTLTFAIQLHKSFSHGFILISLISFLQGLSIRQIRFRFDGQPINETDTPAQVRFSYTHCNALCKGQWSDHIVHLTLYNWDIACLEVPLHFVNHFIILPVELLFMCEM